MLELKQSLLLSLAPELIQTITNEVSSSNWNDFWLLIAFHLKYSVDHWYGKGSPLDLQTTRRIPQSSTLPRAHDQLQQTHLWERSLHSSDFGNDRLPSCVFQNQDAQNYFSFTFVWPRVSRAFVEECGWRMDSGTRTRSPSRSHDSRGKTKRLLVQGDSFSERSSISGVSLVLFLPG